MKKLLIAGIIILVGIIIGLAALRGGGGGEIAEQTAQKVPEFALQDFGGKTVRASDFSGKPLVVNSWAGWCPFCRQELPDFARVQQELGDAVVIIAVDRAELPAAAKRYTDQLGVTDDLVFLLDPTDSFYQSIGGFSMPETILVDADGVIRDWPTQPG
jgi:thiol-disulfide isomerase/thioredoxin